METDALIQAQNKIKQLEEKVAIVEREVLEKQCHIASIESNMKSQYVENWNVTDIDGEKGEFSGNIYWIKGEGTIFYKNNTIFEGDWNSTGEINDGELRGMYSDEVLAKWECGIEMDLDSSEGEESEGEESEGEESEGEESEEESEDGEYEGEESEPLS
jgi:hypothetical protein